MEHKPNVKSINRVYTTGQISKICKVAPRTVSKWFDSGKLEGYIIPESKSRRIPHRCLVQFLSSNRMLHLLNEYMAPDRICMLGCSEILTHWVGRHYPEYEIHYIDNLFIAGTEMYMPPLVTIIDCNSISMSDTVCVTEFLNKHHSQSIVLTKEDTSPEYANVPTATCCIPHPVNLDRLGKVLSTQLGDLLPTEDEPIEDLA